MSQKRIGVHACWLDRECRSYGVPAFTYLNFWWFTVRINPPRDRWLDRVAGEKRWHWDVIQVWRNK